MIVAKQCIDQGPSDEELDIVSMTLRWILVSLKLKVMELIDVLKSIVNRNFGSTQKEKGIKGPKHTFEEEICSTILLSVVSLMIVLVTRVFGS